MNKNDRILILGGRGLVGSAMIRGLQKAGYENIHAPTRNDLDLLIQNDVDQYFKELKPQFVFDAAAKVGGIHANDNYRADFIYENLAIQNNLFKACFENDVEKFLFLGSSCIYPKHAEQPMKEECLLTGPLEPTNEPYAIAKIAGLKMAENFKRQYGKNFFSVMPTNIYGINDNFHPKNSHVIPGMINRMQETLDAGKKTFEIWGTGTVKREFLFADDLADACIFLLNYEGEIPHWVNVGTGTDITIRELGEKIGQAMGFDGEIVFNTDYPDGTPRKLLDTSKINKLGWTPKTSLEDGLSKTVEFFRTADNLRRY